MPGYCPSCPNTTFPHDNVAPSSAANLQNYSDTSLSGYSRPATESHLFTAPSRPNEAPLKPLPVIGQSSSGSTTVPSSYWKGEEWKRRIKITHPKALEELFVQTWRHISRHKGSDTLEEQFTEAKAAFEFEHQEKFPAHNVWTLLDCFENLSRTHILQGVNSIISGQVYINLSNKYNCFNKDIRERNRAIRMDFNKAYYSGKVSTEFDDKSISMTLEPSEENALHVDSKITLYDDKTVVWTINGDEILYLGQDYRLGTGRMLAEGNSALLANV